MIISRSFYTRSDVLQIAKDLLGKVLVSSIGGITTSGIIVETEAYRAPDDRACHAYQNKRTERTETMFKLGGIAYVYICYGIHHLFNVVTGEDGMAHAVLIRAVEPLEGKSVMKSRRKITQIIPSLTNGPGKFTEAMSITKDHNAVELFNAQSIIHIRDMSISVDHNEILTGPRVGMGNIGESALRPWRFRVKNNKWTSKPDIVKYEANYE